jgi:putative peptidoglycan lipid II flippase
MLSRADGDTNEFRRILHVGIFQAIFLTLPLSAALIVLRIPMVRLVYGTKIFDWDATVQTGMVLSVYAIAIVAQTLMSILSRAFFALHDTKTPVKISFIGLGLLVVGDVVLVKIFSLPVWALAASFAFSVYVEAIILLILINKRIGLILNRNFWSHLTKISAATTLSGAVMFFLIKFFDKWYWLKQTTSIPFEKFVLDTSYSLNVLILTVMSFLIGMIVYIVLSLIFNIEEARYFLAVARRFIVRKSIPGIPQKEEEPVTPITPDTQGQ